MKRFSTKFKSLTSFLVIGLIIISCFSVNFANAASSTLMSTDRTVDVNRVKVGDTFTVNYCITPKALTTPQNNNIKDIVLVVDTSLSMDRNLNNNDIASAGSSRLDSVKRVATEFISKFNDSNVNISVVKFHGRASTVMPLTNTSNSSDRKALVDSIKNLNTKGSNGTNIGDGMRNAFYTLGDSNNKHEKYVIVLTDGESNFYSYTGYWNWFHYYWDYYLGNNYTSYYVDGAEGDPKGRSLYYAKLVAKDQIKANNINTYVIGFGPEPTSNNLEISQEAGGTYFKSTSEIGLNNLYNKFFTSINNPSAMINFEETIPEGAEFVTSENPEITVSGRKLYGNIGFYYKRDNNNQQFIAEPINIKITYRAAKSDGSVFQGDRITFLENSGKVTLTPVNFNGKPEILNFDTRCIIDVMPLDKPICIPDITVPTNSNVNVTVKYDINSIRKEYSTDGTIWNEYTGPIVITSNKTVYARSRDAWNRIYYSEPLIVNNIDKTLPTAVIKYSTTNPTNGNVIATLVPNKSVVVLNNNGSFDYTFTENGSFLFSFKDNYGNIGTAVATVNNIDKTPPTARITYSTLKPTNEDVTATLVPSEKVIITNNGGLTSYTFKQKGSFIFQFKDEAGNTGTAKAEVNNIDKTPPTATISYSTTKPTSGKVTAKLIPSEPVIIMNNSGLDIREFTENGSFTFQFMDEAGNTGNVTAVVNNIDKTLPTATISYSYENGYVKATLVPNKAVTVTNNNGSFTYNFFKNGSFTFFFKDAIGNTGSAVASVSSIEPVIPATTVKVLKVNPKKPKSEQIKIQLNKINPDFIADIDLIKKSGDVKNNLSVSYQGYTITDYQRGVISLGISGYSVKAGISAKYDIVIKLKQSDTDNSPKTYIIRLEIKTVSSGTGLS
ncbi:hypothetical protein Q428_01360 [Fervidicella metallireducens AeB]|uniref:VWFA domain-containing protein n=1 Tax=Fervidicella metallireducens AeB TaxID=1403537 RepID=A0A017RZ98_9CLOT|nr:VWA domain-containing protein [Fervidicella metallireducens]EYE89729.1 hypothetical protein Q428_01360 [Fervidicella metallireducens AeB]